MLSRSLRSRQSGLSIVELMVGVAIGLLVVAAATLVVSNQLVENRRLLLETQVQQDLRAAADIVTRELRRAGGWESAINGVWQPGTASTPCNGFAPVASYASPGTSEVDYRYFRQIGSDSPIGFRMIDDKLQYASSVSSPAFDCSTAYAPNNWQDLTDVRTLKVTRFDVTVTQLPATGTGVQLPCTKLCVGGGTACWPTIAVRELTIVLQGQAVHDAAVKRSITTSVRLRNDWVRFNDALNPTQMCPS